MMEHTVWMFNKYAEVKKPNRLPRDWFRRLSYCEAVYPSKGRIENLFGSPNNVDEWYLTIDSAPITIYESHGEWHLGCDKDYPKSVLAAKRISELIHGRN